MFYIEKVFNILKNKSVNNIWTYFDIDVLFKTYFTKDRDLINLIKCTFCVTCPIQMYSL